MIAAERSTCNNIPRETDPDPRLHVTVVFTTQEATLTALRMAGRLAESLRDRVALVAVEVVPLRLSLGLPPVPSDFRQQHLLAVVTESGVDAEEVSIEIFPCRDRRECLRRVLRPELPVVIGGKRRWWSQERKLARWLGLIGRQVVFVDVGARKGKSATGTPCTMGLM